MKNLLKSMALGVGVFSMLALASCSNEESVTNPEPNPAPEGYANITIVVPGLQGTKATSEVSTAEATIKSLYLCAFPVANSGSSSTTGEILIKELATSGNMGTSSYPTTGYTAQLKLGTYHIYVLANLNDYLVEGKKINRTNITKEDDIKDLTLNFSTYAGNKQIISSSNLPMYCDYLNIKTGEDNSTKVDLGNYVVSGGDQKIYADMDLLVAKIRYTVLFDITDYKNQFLSQKGVDFDNAKLFGIAKATDIYSKTSPTPITYDNSGVEITFNKYGYEKTLADQYLAATTDKESTIPADFSSTPKTTWDDNTDTQRVWQGIVYVPENKASEAANQTIVTLTPATNSNIKNDNGNCDFKLTSVERGNFYDIVAKLLTPGKMNYDVNVYVKVNPWTYQPKDVLEW